MKKYNINNEEDLKFACKELFPNESYAKAIELIQRTKFLVPITEDRINYLDILFTYVDGIINGDDIEQYVTKKYISNMAKKALSEISSEVHEKELECYKKESLSLKTKIEDLTQEQNVLTAQIENLKLNKSSLVKETSILQTELEKLKKELEDAKINGMTKVQKEVSNELNKLKNEVCSLNTQKENLVLAIADLKDSIDKYNKQINNLCENEDENVQVIWELLKKDSVVYGLNNDSIDAYIKSLIKEYASKTKVSLEEAENIIKVNCSGLYTIKSILNINYRNSSDYGNSSIGLIISKLGSLFSPDCAEDIEQSLKTIKLPKYEIKKGNIETPTLAVDNSPTNVNQILRELHFQKMALMAKSKQKIAETQVEALITLLQSVLPKDYDINQFIPSIKEIGVDISEQNEKFKSYTPKL